MSQQIRTARCGRPLRPVRSLACAVALTALGLQMGAPAALAATGRRPLGAATPEALVERVNAATARDDEEGILEGMACITPHDRTPVVGAVLLGTILRGTAVKEDDDKAKAQAWQKKYEATMRKHDLEELLELVQLDGEEGPKILVPLLAADETAQTELLRALLKDTDDMALLEDLLVLLREAGGQQAAPDRLPDRPLEIVKVDGDRATAQGGKQTVNLEKIDGRWYMRWYR